MIEELGQTDRARVFGRYEGEWASGRHDGVGLMLWPNGQKYDGEWMAGEMHGEGVHRWQNGTCREGVWAKGERQKWTTSESFGLLGPHAKKRAASVKAKEKEKREGASSSRGTTPKTTARSGDHKGTAKRK